MNLNFTTLRIRHILILYGSCDQKGNLMPKTKKVHDIKFLLQKRYQPIVPLYLSKPVCALPRLYCCVEVMSILIARFSGLLADCSA